MDRTYTRRQQTAELARIDAQLEVMRNVLAAFDAAAILDGGRVPGEIGLAWNAAHDAVTVLEAERREVELNRLTGTTAALIAANID